MKLLVINCVIVQNNDIMDKCKINQQIKFFQRTIIFLTYYPQQFVVKVLLKVLSIKQIPLQFELSTSQKSSHFCFMV